MQGKFSFEVKVDDVKTSRVKDDTCPVSGEFVYDGTEVKFKGTFKADAQDVFESMLGGVGSIVTLAVIDNKQQTL